MRSCTEQKLVDWFTRIVAFLLIISSFGCSTSAPVKQPAFTELSPEQQLKYAESRLYSQRIKFLKTMNAFLHFMNDNQTKWEFRIPGEFSVSIAGENHFSVTSGLAKPNTSLVSIGSILAIDRENDVKVTMTSHGFLMLEHIRLGWSSGVTDWWKAEIRGTEIVRLFPQEEEPGFKQLVENLDAAMASFFNTYYGRADGILNEHIKDHMLRNPLFF